MAASLCLYFDHQAPRITLIFDHGSDAVLLRMFLSSHTQSPYGIRFSTQPYSTHEDLISCPLYTVMHACGSHTQHMQDAISYLVKS